MKKKLFYLIFLALSLYSCNDNKRQEEETIILTESNEFQNAGTDIVEYAEANQLSTMAFNSQKFGTSNLIDTGGALEEFNKKLSSQPLLFLENRGQVLDAESNPRTDILFMAKRNEVKIFLTGNALHYQFSKDSLNKPDTSRIRETHLLTIQLLNSSPSPEIKIGKQEIYTENYYSEHFPEGLLGIRSFSEIVLKNVYPGIDWIIYSKGNFMEYDFIVHPGADPKNIRFKINDADDVLKQENGDLKIITKLGEIIKHAPVSYVEGRKVPSRLQQFDDSTFGFDVKAPEDKILRIDPYVEWGTYFGSVYTEKLKDIKTDSNGNIFITGSTKSNFGIAHNGYDNTYSGSSGDASFDAFLAKFSPSGELIWSTYYGGDKDDLANSLAIHGNDVYLAGTTFYSPSTIATMKYNVSSDIEIDGSGLFYVINPNFSGDAMTGFLAKFNGQSGQRDWGGLYSMGRDGMENTDALDCAVSSDGSKIYLLENVYFEFDAVDDALGIISFISAFIPELPMIVGMIVTVAQDAYHTFAPPGSTSCAQVYCLSTQNGSYIGDRTICSENAGGFPFVATALATGNGDNVYVVGYTVDNKLQENLGGSDYPYSEIRGDGLFDYWSNGIYHNMQDEHRIMYGTQIMIIQFKSATLQWGGNLVSHRLYGGFGTEIPTDILVDRLDNNHVYVVGGTNNFILSGNNYNGGVTDGLIAQFDMGNGSLLWSTYFGGNKEDIIQASTMSSDNYLYVVGTTVSTNGISIEPGNFHSGGDRDAFVAKYSRFGEKMWSSYVGGAGWDDGTSVTTFGKAFYVGGVTGSTNNIATAGGHQPEYDNGLQQGFLRKYIHPGADNNGIIYVKQGATGSGSSWDAATGNLQEAINTPGVSQVWVAAGEYQRLSGEYFSMKDNVQIFGGFPNTGNPTFEDRNWETYETILKGNGNSVIRNYAEFLSYSARLDGFTIRNGNSNLGGGMFNDASNTSYPLELTIANCKFENNVATNGGGGMYNSYARPELINCKFENNTAARNGGGMFNNNMSYPKLTNCVFSFNKVTDSGTQNSYGGGGISNVTNSYPKIENCIFNNNTAPYGGGILHEDYAGFAHGLSINNGRFSSNHATKSGGGVYAKANGVINFKSCIFEGNTANESGGGLYNSASGFDTSYGNIYSTATNCLFSGNKAQNGAAVYTIGFDIRNSTFAGNMTTSSGSTIQVGGFGFKLTNSVIYGNNSTISSGGNNLTVTYNLIQGGFTGEGNFDADPLFINSPSYDTAPFIGGDYSLQVTSPAINRGINEAIPYNLILDLAGLSRLHDCKVDLGAYEYQGSVLSIPDSNGIIYVKENGNGNGNSWENATTLSEALLATDCNDNIQHIWVAGGVHTPKYSPLENTFRQASGRDNAFVLKKDVKIFGGFNGTETSVDERDWIANETILSGDLDYSGTINENDAYHVIIAAGDTGDAELNGFTITGGNANGLENIEVNQIVVPRNYGGGLRIRESSPILKNLIIKGNVATYGGGISISNAAPVIMNSLLIANTSTGVGGAVHNDNHSNAVFLNVSIADNFAGTEGSAMRNYDSDPFIQNSIVIGHVSNFNSVPSISYSLVEGNSNLGNGNIPGATNPLFVNAAEGNYRLQLGSPVINTGSNTAYTAAGGNLENDPDLAGNPRLMDEFIDMGAYEFILPGTCPDSTTWDGTIWSNGEPDLSKKAIIDGELILTSDLTACELRVTENGSLEVLSGFTFTVNGSVTNHAGAEGFVVASGGNLIQTEEVENEGAITVIRNSQPIKRLDYTLWSSPVAGQNLFGFSPETVNGVTNYPGSTGRIYIYDGVNGYVNPQPFDENLVMETGAGYLFRAPNNFHATNKIPYEGKFTGVPVNGTVNVPLTQYGEIEDRYTSVGNPYPSSIRATGVNSLLSENSHIGDLHFWLNGSGAYMSCSTVGCTDGAIFNLNYISVGQGFIVRSLDESMPVTFTNAMRVSEEADFINKTDEGENHRFRLNLSDEKIQSYTRTLTAYTESSTDGIDHQIDTKLFAYNGSALYQIVEEEKFVIQGRALPFDVSDVVPLGFRAAEEGKFKISLTDFEGLFAEGSVTIYLKDNDLAITHNLMESDYEFESAEGEFKERFEVVYEAEGTMGTADLHSNLIQIYQENEIIIIESKSEKILSVELYDLQGRNIYKNEKVNANVYRIKSISFGVQVLVVKVQTEHGEILTKKIINK